MQTLSLEMINTNTNHHIYNNSLHYITSVIVRGQIDGWLDRRKTKQGASPAIFIAGMTIQALQASQSPALVKGDRHACHSTGYRLNKSNESLASIKKQLAFSSTSRVNLKARVAHDWLA